MHAEVGEAEISDGWKQFGRVRLLSHAGFAYDALWKTILELASTMLLAGSISCLLGYLVLRRIKAPLQAVVHQAQEISIKHFVTIPEPKVPELKQLARAMNKTVLRLKEVFEAEAEKLEGLRKEANTDPVTGVANRSFFMSSLRAVLNNEDTNKGNLILVRIANLAEVNKEIGRKECDKLICAIAECLESYTLGHNQAMVARLNGSDFALLTLESDIGFVMAKAVLTSLRQTTNHWIKPEQIIFVGIANFSQGLDMSQLLAEADRNLAEAEITGGLNLRDASIDAEGANLPSDREAWLEVFKDVLKNNRTKIGQFAVLDAKGALIHDECPLRLQLFPQGEWQPAGKFIAMAERLNMTHLLDLAAVKLAIEQLSTDANRPPIAINLSVSSILHQDFDQTLLALLKKHNKVTHKLWIEVGAEQAFLHFNQFKAFSSALKGTGITLGIEHFGQQFAQIGMLYDLGLNYIKVDATFVNDVDQNTGNQIFLQGLVDIAHNIGIQVIAEGVSNEAEREMVISLGFDGVTGTAVKV